MPIYEYHCKDCRQNFESLVFGNETPGCPFCNSKSVLKKMSACRFVSRGNAPDGTQTVQSSASASPCSGCTAASCAGCSSS